MHSLLITSARTQRELAKATESGANVLILDAAAVAAFASARVRRPQGLLIHVRVGALVTAAELGSIVAAAPDGVVLAGVERRGNVVRLSAMIATAEAIAGLPDGAIGVVAMIATAGDVLGVSSLPGATPRLQGIAWDAEALAASVGAGSPRDAHGRLNDLCRAARAQCLFAAAAAGIPAFDTACPLPTDGAALEAEAMDARQQGFAGKLAVSPDQVPVINSVFGRVG